MEGEKLGRIAAERAGVAGLSARALIGIVDGGAVVGRGGECAVGILHSRCGETEGYAHSLHTGIVGRGQCAAEIVPAAFVGTPRDLGEGTEAREEHIVEVVVAFGRMGDVDFAEKRCLDAGDIGEVAVGEALLREVEREHLLSIENRSPVVSRLVRRLLHIEIEIFARHNDGRITLLGRLQTVFDTLPAVDTGIGRESATIDSLVPDGGTFAVLGEDCRNAGDEVILDLLLVGKTLFAFEPLAVGAGTPLRHIDLVATYVDIFGGEYAADFADDVVDKGIVALLGGAPDIADVETVGAGCVGGKVAEDVVADCTHSLAVAGHIDFGNHLDIAHGSIAVDVAQFGLCVVATPLFGEFAVARIDRRVATTETADVGKFGMGFQFDAPALVVGKVEVEFVDFVVGEQVDIAFDSVGGNPCACNIEQYTAIGETRGVLNMATDDLGGQVERSGIDGWRKQLEERLYAVEYTAVVATRDNYAIAVDIKAVCLTSEVMVEAQGDGVGFYIRFCRALQRKILGKICGGIVQRLVPQQSRAGVYREPAVGTDEADGVGNDVGRDSSAGECEQCDKKQVFEFHSFFGLIVTKVNKSYLCSNDYRNLIMDKNLEATARLLEIMDTLREKCPWDREQTFHSLRNNTIEETFELADAITDENMEGIREELGDLLLHIVFYSKLGKEQGAFDYADVANGVCDKLIYRHPHVYGDVLASSPEEVKKNWEALKLRKKARKSGILGGVPRSLPSMVKAFRISEKAAAAGFDWQKKEDIWDKVKEEIGEVETEMHNGDKERIEGEFGDLFFALVNACRLYGVDPENALERTNEKFMHRFAHVEKRVAEQDKMLNEVPLDELEGYWQEAKHL